MPTDTTDELVPDPQVRREFGNVSEMTIWRWDRCPRMAELGWPHPVRINGRKYRPRKGLNEVRENLLRRAIAERAEAQKPEGKIAGAARRPRAPAPAGGAPP